MTKYVIAILVLVAVLAGVLLYIGDDARIVISSTAETGILAFAPWQPTWQGFIVICLLGLLTLFALWSLTSWLVRLPSRMKSGLGLRRRTQALDAMEEALIAGAEGDSAKARKKAERARSLISSAALGQMISAHAAEASGDSEEAIAQYSAMLENEKTYATGQRGLAQQLLAIGNVHGAIDHAGKAYNENKNARWAFDILFQAQLQDRRWSDAAETITRAEARKHIQKDPARRRRAVLLTAEADRLSDNGETQPALEQAILALKDSAGFAPASALAAKLCRDSGDDKRAAVLLEKAWTHGPHPALSLAYQDLLRGIDGRKRAKRLANFIKSNPHHRESQILSAEEALLNGDAVKAWGALSPLIQGETVSARLCALAAKIEGALHNAADARVWLERAASAPAEADWSDMDPEGDAFDYTDQDWRRLVFSYGEKGELIHPRFEAGSSRLSVSAKLSDNNTAGAIDGHNINEKGDIAPPRQSDDPGVGDIKTSEALDKDDLAERLDSLLDESNKPFKS